MQFITFWVDAEAPFISDNVIQLITGDLDLRHNLFIARSVDRDYVATINDIGDVLGPGKEFHIVCGCKNYVTISRPR